MHTGIRFVYLRDSDRRPHTCVAIRVVPEKNEIHYATATHNTQGRADLKARIDIIHAFGGIVPTELKNKLTAFPHNVTNARARDIATKRLLSNPKSLSYTDDLSCHDITRLVMQSIYVDNDRYTYVAIDGVDLRAPVFMQGAPMRAREGAGQWLLENSTPEEYMPFIQTVEAARQEADIKWEDELSSQMGSYLQQFSAEDTGS